MDVKGTGGLKVSEVAERARVTVRTLHHYDEIGLVAPSGRSAAGYRLYSEPDVERLFQVIMFRGLGLPLEEIRGLLDGPARLRAEVLRRHRDSLLEERQKMDAMIHAVDQAIETMDDGGSMTRDDMDAGFDAFANAPSWVREQQAEHGAEVAQRWGDTDAYRESRKRATRHSREDWKRIRAENDANEARMAELLAAGAAPDGAEAMAAAERMREHIEQWFYPCSHDMHASLAEMYVADPRFAAHYDNRSDGLAAFVAASIRANAARHGAG